MTRSRVLAAFGAAALLALGIQSTALADETLYLDSYSAGATGAAGPVTSNTILLAGHTYVLTVDGTISTSTPAETWDLRPTCGTPENAPMFPSPSAPRNYKVGQDAAYIFSRPLPFGQRFCPPLPSARPNFEIQVDTGSGFTHYEPDGGPAFMDGEHVYTFTVQGQNQPVSFRYVDTNTTDNYGQLQVIIPSNFQDDKAGVIAYLQANRPTGTDATSKDMNHEFDEAIQHIGKSLSAKYWSDANHPSVKDGNHVFDEEKGAVKELMENTAMKNYPPAKTAIGKLVAIDRGLAKRAIDETTIPTTGKPDKISTAKKELQTANNELAKGDSLVATHPDQAIDHYKNAWQHAIKAQQAAAQA